VIFTAFAWSRAVTQPIERDAIYRRRRFPRDVIETCVRWYLTYRLSYRDLVSLMAEREVHVTHTTIMRWVFQFVPEYERRWNRRAKPVGSSWRVDETFIRTRPEVPGKGGALRVRIVRLSFQSGSDRPYVLCFEDVNYLARAHLKASGLAGSSRFAGEVSLDFPLKRGGGCFGGYPDFQN
jgi:hypothetical protein